VSDILEGGAGLAARHILVFLRITAPLTLPVGLLFGGIVFWFANSSGRGHDLALGILVAVGVVYALAAMVSGAACLKVAAEVYTGTSPSAQAALALVLRRLRPVLALTTLLVLGAVPAVALFALPGLTAIGNYSLLLLVLALLSLRVSGTYSVALPAMLLEEKGIVDSLRRSAQLVRRRFFRALGTVLFGGVLAVFAGVLVAILVSIFSLGGESVVLIVTLVGFGLGELFVAPFYVAFLVVLYGDLRVRERIASDDQAS
jgi:hypothetical protein